MATYQVEVKVMPREALLDPQGQTVEHALTALGFASATGVRIGRLLTLTVNGQDLEDARAQAERMCEKLLANPVTEDFTVNVSDAF